MQFSSKDRFWSPRYHLYFWLYLQTQSQGHHTIDRLEERGIERGNARRSSLKGWERAIVNQTNIGTVQQRWRNLWKTGWSACGLSWAQRSHLELKKTERVLLYLFGFDFGVFFGRKGGEYLHCILLSGCTVEYKLQQEADDSFVLRGFVKCMRHNIHYFITPWNTLAPSLTRKSNMTRILWSWRLVAPDDLWSEQLQWWAEWRINFPR